MGNDLRPVQSYINLDAIDAENDAMVKKVKETVAAILGEFKKTKGIELKLSADPASAKQIRMAIEDLDKTQKKLQKSIADLNKVRAEQIKQDLLQEKLATQRKKTMQEEVKLNDLNTKSKEKAANAAKKEADAAQKASNAYDQLNQRYKIAANTAKRLGAEQGALSQDFLAASAQAQKLYKELYQLERAVGQNQREVGNYRDGFSQLGNSFNQLTRELPAFTNSVQTGFLALSNNIPIFFDQIQRTNAEIKALRAEGKETQGLMSRLGSAFFSFGTILSVGVTLLTMYGDEIGNFFAAIFKGKDAIDAFVEKQRAINEAFKDSAVKEAFENLEKVGAAFRLAKDGAISKKEALKVYNETLGDTLGKASDLETAEKLYAANSDNYIKATLYRAAAQQALAKAADSALKAIQAQTKSDDEALTLGDKFVKFGVANSSTAPGFAPGLNNTSQDRARAGQFAKEQAKIRKDEETKAELEKQKTFEQIADELFQKAKEYSAKLPNFSLFGDAETATKNGDKIKSINKSFFDAQLKDQADALKKLSEAEDLYYTTRVNARNEAAALELQIINGRKDTELANIKSTRDAVLADKASSNIDKLNAENEYRAAEKKLTEESNYEILRLSQQLQSDLFSIKLSSIARQRQLDAEAAELAQEAFKNSSPAGILEQENIKIKKELERRTDFIKTDADIRLRALEENYQKEYEAAKGNPAKISSLEERTALERLKIQNDLNRSLLIAELDYAQDYLEVLRSLGMDTVSQEQRIAELRKKIAEGVTKSKKDNSAKEIDIEAQKAAKLRELAEAGKDLIFSAIQGSFDQRKNQIQEEIEELDKKKQKDIEVANATITNEQDRAAAIATINARSQAQKEQLELRQRKIDQERAKFERLKTIVDIVQNTAIAISAQTKGLPATAPIIALIGAIGAAQIGTVLARPIPKYATGTEDHPGGHAVVGDGGKSEMVITPDGKLMLTPSVPTLMNLPEHSIVLPDAKKATRMLANMAVDNTIMGDRIDGRAGRDRATSMELAAIHRLLKDQASMRPIFKNGEFRAMLVKGQSFTEYLNQHL